MLNPEPELGPGPRQGSGLVRGQGKRCLYKMQMRVPRTTHTKSAALLWHGRHYSPLSAKRPPITACIADVSKFRLPKWSPRGRVSVEGAWPKPLCMKSEALSSISNERKFLRVEVYELSSWPNAYNIQLKTFHFNL